MKINVAITLGDPAGIGPEIVVKALSELRHYDDYGFVIVGDRLVFERALKVTGISLDYQLVSESRTEFDPGITLVDLNSLTEHVEFGVESPEAGRVSGRYIEKAVDLCMKGAVDAVCTAPINKRSFNAGGFDFPGHTEFLAALTGSESFEMSFIAGDMFVVLLSRHFALRDALGMVTRDNVGRLIRFTNRELASLLGKAPKIAVAGLNPHASDGGMFGSEETEILAPAIADAAEEGILVSGPHSPDTIFLRGYRGEFDAVIALYHDQATIPVKCLSFGRAVNMTLGLPIIRTSVDHGTAYDIAGKNVAESGSMVTAIETAAKLAVQRKQ